jgi:TonB-dependent receptor
MNKIMVRNAVRRALLGLSAAAGGVALPALGQEELPEGIPAGATQMEEIVVTGRQYSVATDVLEERIEAEVVADIVSSEQIARVGDSTVSLALRRLPGVTLVGDQYVYIRGLGERYSSTTLNGAYVPSPDLTRNVIPLDLFPAEIVKSISIQKGYSPDKPAAFGGGNVDVRTRGIPDEFVFSLQLGTGWNSESSNDGLTYPGGGDDRWGTDDGTRALPSEISAAIDQYQGDISATNIYNTLIRDGEFHSFAEAELINRQIATALNRDVDFRSKSMGPDLSGEVAIGNSWYLGDSEQWRVGLLALGDYKDQWRNRDRIVRSVGDPEDVDRVQRTINQVVLTGSLGIGVDFAGEQRVEANAIYLRNTEDEASLTLGNNFNFPADNGQQLRNYRIRYEERALELFQLGGSHRLGPETLGLFDDWFDLSFLEGLSFNWYWSDAKAKTDIPNEVAFLGRDTIDPDTREVFSTSIRPNTTAGDFRFTNLEDDVTSYGTAVQMPFEFANTVVEASGGYDYYEKGRSYLQTQLNLGTSASAALPALVGTPGTVYTDENILDPLNGFQLGLGGLGTESYLAGETVTAAWGKVDLLWNDTWRLMAGARWEDFERVSVPIDQYEYDPSVGKIRLSSPDQSLESFATAEDDYYPAAAITWIKPGFWADDFQLRFGWSKTVARPDLREISDATYIDPLTEARVRGNPDLVNSNLTNYDLRAEWFFANNNNLTVSLFYKDISDPIETVAAPGTDDNVGLTFINGESAEVYGVEFEGLASLDLMDSTWDDGFFISGNLTLSDSEIVIGDASLGVTNNKRRMTQHSDYVANAQLGWDSPGGAHSASLVYSIYSERIFFAGRNGAEDAWEQPFKSLDLVWSWFPTDALSFKLRLQNLLDEKLEIEQGGVKVLEQTVGTTFKLDASYRF